MQMHNSHEHGLTDAQVEFIVLRVIYTYIWG